MYVVFMSGLNLYGLSHAHSLFLFFSLFFSFFLVPSLLHFPHKGKGKRSDFV